MIMLLDRFHILFSMRVNVEQRVLLTKLIIMTIKYEKDFRVSLKNISFLIKHIPNLAALILVLSPSLDYFNTIQTMALHEVGTE